MKHGFASLAAAWLLCLCAGLAHAQDDSATLRGRLQVREAAQDALSTLHEFPS